MKCSSYWLIIASFFTGSFQCFGLSGGPIAGVGCVFAQEAAKSSEPAPIASAAGQDVDLPVKLKAWTEFPQAKEGGVWLLPNGDLDSKNSPWSIAAKSYFEGHGKIDLADGVLTLGKGNPGSGLVANFEVPKINYEISFQARRTQGSDFFCGLTFPFADQQATLILGGWGGSTVGISNVNNFSAIENSTSRTVEFQQNRWYDVKLRVAENEIECFLDGKSLFWQETQEKRFTIWWEQKPMAPLGFASWQTTGQIRKVRLEKVEPKAFDD